MKIRYKLLLMMVFLCMSFLTLGSFFLYNKYSPATLIIIGIALYVLTALFTYAFFVKRIERLNKDLVDIQSGLLEILTIPAGNPDEIAEISVRINDYLEAIKLLRQQVYFLGNDAAENAQSLGALLSKRMDLAKMTEQADSSKLPGRIFFNEALNKTLSYVKRHKKLAAVKVYI